MDWGVIARLELHTGVECGLTVFGRLANFLFRPTKEERSHLWKEQLRYC